MQNASCTLQSHHDLCVSISVPITAEKDGLQDPEVPDPQQEGLQEQEIPPPQPGAEMTTFKELPSHAGGMILCSVFLLFSEKKRMEMCFLQKNTDHVEARSIY